jgi:hypothetical protein
VGKYPWSWTSSRGTYEMVPSMVLARRIRSLRARPARRPRGRRRRCRRGSQRGRRRDRRRWVLPGGGGRAAARCAAHRHDRDHHQAQDSSHSGHERWYHAAGCAHSLGPMLFRPVAGHPGASTVTETGPPSARHSSLAALAVTSEDDEPSTAADREHLPDTGVRVSLAAYGHPDLCAPRPAWGPPPTSGRIGITIVARRALSVGGAASPRRPPVEALPIHCLHHLANR